MKKKSAGYSDIEHARQQTLKSQMDTTSVYVDYVMTNELLFIV